MASSPVGMRRRPGPPDLRGPHPILRRHSRPQRLLFTGSLLFIFVSSLWTSLTLLAHVYPALFPGRDLKTDFHLVDVISSNVLPPSIQLPSAGADSVFNERINFIVMGVDRRPDEDHLEAQRTDTLMLVTVEPLSKQTSVISIPRDILINIKLVNGESYDGRINESFERGLEEGGTIDAGARQLKNDIRNNFGIEIDYWVLLDFRGVEKLVDALGGIDVVIPEELEVPRWRYSDDDSTIQYVQFDAGPAHLDGYDAVAFGRYRDSGRADLDRVLRQQLVLEAAMGKVFSQALLDNPLGLWDAYGALIKTDIPKGRMLGLGALARSTNGAMAMYSLGDEFAGMQMVEDHTTPQGASVLRINQDALARLLAYVFVDPAYAGATVEIEDATGDYSGARAEALGRHLLVDRAIPEVNLGASIAPRNTTSIALYNPNRRGLAEEIATWLGLPKSAIVPVTPAAGSSLPDIVITIGQGFSMPTVGTVR